MTQFKNIFIAGGSGFVGKNIILQLGDKYNLLAPNHAELDLLDKDAVERFFNEHTIDVVIHAAAVGVKKTPLISNAIEKNMKIFFNIANLQKKWKKMIFLGSGAEYDKRQDLKQVTEMDFGRSIPVDDYGAAKYLCSLYIESAEHIINLRCFGVYGKYEDSTQRFISSAILDVLAGRPITIGQNVWFDYLYVDDLIAIIDYFINHEATYKFYNVASGMRVDLLTLAGIVERISGSKRGIKVVRDGLNREYTADNSRLKSELPDFKFTSLEDGIKKMFEFYSKADDQ